VLGSGPGGEAAAVHWRRGRRRLGSASGGQGRRLGAAKARATPELQLPGWGVASSWEAMGGRAIDAVSRGEREKRCLKIHAAEIKNG